jgi:HK97 family phage prohead protease
MERKKLEFELKQTAEGSFEGLLSPFNVVDGGGDVVEPAAYIKNLKDKGNVRPLLWQHRSDTPIGVVTLENKTDGLWCKGTLLMALPEAQKAYLLVKNKIVSGLSIGFKSVQDAVVDGTRHLKEIILYEASVVTFPMAESAVIASVKSAHGQQTLQTHIEELTRTLRSASADIDRRKAEDIQRRNQYAR